MGQMRYTCHRGIWQSLGRLVAAALAPALLAFSGAASACPAALFLTELDKPLTGPRHQTRLFVFDGDGTQGKPVPLQTDPVDDEGHLQFFDDFRWWKEPHDEDDLLTFYTSDLGRRMKPKTDELPCQGGRVYEVRDPHTGTYGYLTNCEPEEGTFIIEDGPVAYLADRHRLKSDHYRYVFHPENHMQFKKIAFADGEKAWQLAAKDSRLLISADIANFFNMEFDSEDIISRLERSRSGPVGEMARLSFYLKILMFEIKMSLATDVGFYRSSGHIPMMVSLPVDARKYLNPGSGILYSWIPAKGDADKWSFNKPPLDAEVVHEGIGSAKKKGLTACTGDTCRYDVSVDVGGKLLSMAFRIKRSLVEKGFYPQFVGDVAAVNEDMDWSPVEDEKRRRLGVYFEVSGLPKGGHPWDFWLTLGSKAKEGTACPRPVKAAKLETSSP